MSTSFAGKSTGRARYDAVHVLLISWEHDNLGVIEEISDLQHVFQNLYHYSTEKFSIPSSRVHNALAKRLADSLYQHEAKENLLIVHYGGHGHMNDDRQCIWSW